jgi:hypothetical protein
MERSDGVGMTHVVLVAVEDGCEVGVKSFFGTMVDVEVIGAVVIVGENCVGRAVEVGSGCWVTSRFEQACRRTPNVRRPIPNNTKFLFVTIAKILTIASLFQSALHNKLCDGWLIFGAY